MNNAQIIIERLEENATVKAQIIFYRPTVPEGQKNYYEFHQTELITNPNKYYKFYNRFTNYKFEHYTHEFELPAKYFKKLGLKGGF